MSSILKEAFQFFLNYFECPNLKKGAKTPSIYFNLN